MKKVCSDYIVYSLPRSFLNFVSARDDRGFRFFVNGSSILVLGKNVNLSTVEKILDNGILIDMKKPYRPL